MHKTVETTGKTIDDAIAAALSELNAEREEVSVEVVEKPKAGFLGIGGTPAKVRVVYELTKEAEAQKFLEGLFERMRVSAHPEMTVREDGSIKADLKGESLGILIGRRGDTLDAIQHITANVINRGGESGTWTRIVLDIENYRQKREESLARLARATATKVAKSRRNITLEPMNAYERHVIHASLQDWRDVTTFSSGTEPRRCVVIAYGRQRGDKSASAAAGPRTGAPRGVGPSVNRQGHSGGYAPRTGGQYPKSGGQRYGGRPGVNSGGGVRRENPRNDRPADNSLNSRPAPVPPLTNPEDDSM